MRVDFFLGGWPKTGSTSLDYYLSQHPELHMCPVKETYFHCSDIIASAKLSGMQHFYPYVADDAYSALFDGRAKTRVLGESSVFYVVSEEAVKNIAHHNADAKLILLLRDPVEVLDSWFHYLREHTREDAASLTAALDLQQPRSRGSNIPANTQALIHLQYDAIVDYPTHIRRVREHLPDAQVRIILYDSFRDRPRETLASLYSFLDVDSGFSPDLTRRNVSRQQRFPRVHQALGRQKDGIEKLLRIARLDGTNSFARRLYQQVASRNEPRLPLSPEVRTALQQRCESLVGETEELMKIDLLERWGYK